MCVAPCSWRVRTNSNGASYRPLKISSTAPPGNPKMVCTPAFFNPSIKHSTPVRIFVSPLFRRRRIRQWRKPPFVHHEASIIADDNKKTHRFFTVGFEQPDNGRNDVIHVRWPP